MVESPNQYQTVKKELSGWAPIPPVSQQVTYSNPVTLPDLLQDQHVLTATPYSAETELKINFEEIIAASI